MEKAPSLDELAALIRDENIPRLQLRGILYSLMVDGSDQAVEILDTAAGSLDSDGLGDLTHALVWLAQRGSHAAADALIRQALHLPSLLAAQAVLREGLHSSKEPDEAVFALLHRDLTSLLTLDPLLEKITAEFLNNQDSPLNKRMQAAAERLGLKVWLILVNALATLDSVGAERILGAFPAMNPGEQNLLRNELERLATAGSDWAVTLLTRLFIEHGDAGSAAVLKQNAIWPVDETLRGEFFFLAEAWTALDELDFDNRLIKRAYQSANDAVRQRILTAARRSGRLDWLEAGTSSSRKRWLTDLDDSSFSALITRLIENEKVEEAWKLVLHAPLRQAVLAVGLMAQVEQTPWEMDAQDWAQLASLAVECRANLPGLKTMQTGRLRPGLITTAAISAESSLLSVCGEDGSADFYSLPSLAGQRNLPPSSGARFLSALPIEQTDSATAAAADSSIKVVRLADGRVLKSMNGHNGLIKGLAYDPATRQLYSAGFDRSIRAWSFPEGLPRASASAESEVFALAVIPSAGLLASGTADGKVRLWRASDLAALGELPGAGSSAVLSLHASADGSVLAALDRSGAIFFWNPLSARLLGQVESGEITQAVVLLPDGRTAFRLQLSNQITGICVPGGQQFGSAKLSDFNAAFLFALATGQLLALAPDGSYQIISTETAAFTLRSASGQVQIPAGLPRCWRQLAQALHRARHRYDVEIGDHAPISSGDFDIFLDGV